MLATKLEIREIRDIGDIGELKMFREIRENSENFAKFSGKLKFLSSKKFNTYITSAQFCNININK